MADVILKQEYLGSAIRQADDEDCFGFITALNIHFHKVCLLFIPSSIENYELTFQSEVFVVQIQNYIINNAPQSERTYWHDLMYGERLGILVSERLVNIPNALVPQLHETIYEEV